MCERVYAYVGPYKYNINKIYGEWCCIKKTVYPTIRHFIYFVAEILIAITLALTSRRCWAGYRDYIAHTEIFKSRIKQWVHRFAYAIVGRRNEQFRLDANKHWPPDTDTELR